MHFGSSLRACTKALYKIYSTQLSAVYYRHNYYLFNIRSGRQAQKGRRKAEGSTAKLVVHLLQEGCERGPCDDRQEKNAEHGLIGLLPSYFNFKCEQPFLWDQTKLARGVEVTTYSRYFANSCPR